jgi:glutaredoxin
MIRGATMWLFSRRSERPLPHVSVVVYSRSNCPLCDEAKHFLDGERERLGFSLTVVDIDSDPQLKAKYDHSVPVTEVAGRERFRGQINPVLWSRLIRAL